MGQPRSDAAAQKLCRCHTTRVTLLVCAEVVAPTAYLFSLYKRAASALAGELGLGSHSRDCSRSRSSSTTVSHVRQHPDSQALPVLLRHSESAAGHQAAVLHIPMGICSHGI